MKTGDRVPCPIWGREQRVYRDESEGVALLIACPHGREKPVALDSWRARGWVALACALMLGALLALGTCAGRLVQGGECPPVVCPLGAGICPGGCACRPQAPGDTFGRCVPCASE